MEKTNSYINIMDRYSRRLYPYPSSLESSGILKGSIRAVLFDIYGTLFISESGDVTVARKKVTSKRFAFLLKRYSVDLDADETKKRFFQEIEKRHAKLRDNGVDFPEVEIDRVWMNVLPLKDLDTARKFATEYEMLFNPVWPMPFLKILLQRLRAQDIKMGIISNAQFFTCLLFEHFLGSKPEDLGFNDRLMFYSFEHGYAKPSQVLFKMARDRLKDMGIIAHNTVYVGNDMLNDIFPAHGVGFQTALFAGDKRSLRLREDDERCKFLSPELVIRNLKELSEHISKQNKSV
ncbi:MAG: HAD family hydrolase [Spirochaetota bacterium]|nr:MAG: HAD family hydrolase [Spirochaetota bacterium]